MFCCSYSHNVAPKGKFIAFVSTEAESEQPEIELKPGLDLLGPVDEIFYDMYDRFEPVNECSLDNCFISSVSFLSLRNFSIMFIFLFVLDFALSVCIYVCTHYRLCRSTNDVE